MAQRGETHRLMERHDDALADLNRAIGLDPSDEDYTAIRDEIHRLLGESEGASPGM
jgi:hypothetical protein